MKVRRFSPKPAAVKEFALAVCLIVAAVLFVVGVAQIFAPAGWLVAGLSTAGLAVLFLFGDEEAT